MRSSIEAFLQHAHESNIAFYNECTLQMELGMYLRQTFPDLRVTLERPITSFGLREPGAKKEIDIAVTDENDQPHTAIEIKMPLNGRVPLSMFDYCEDIQFCECLCRVGFRSAFALIYTPDRDFWQGRFTTGIYSYFRARAPITGIIPMPTQPRDRSVRIDGSYLVSWRHHLAPYGYAITETLRAEQTAGE